MMNDTKDTKDTNDTGDTSDTNDNETKEEVIRCRTGCCVRYVRPYPLERLGPNFSSGNSGVRKAGSFIFDPSTEKVLLVQSRGQMWGPPKGSMKVNESPLNCALREVQEETGLFLEESHLGHSMIVKSKAIYYLTSMPECPVHLQTDQDDNDANGIGWFRVQCVQELVQSGEISINHPCRLLIQRVFGKEISFNVNSFTPVLRRSPGRHHRIAQKEEDD